MRTKGPACFQDEALDEKGVPALLSTFYAAAQAAWELAQKLDNPIEDILDDETGSWSIRFVSPRGLCTLTRGPDGEAQFRLPGAIWTALDAISAAYIVRVLMLQPLD